MISTMKVPARRFRILALVAVVFSGLAAAPAAAQVVAIGASNTAGRGHGHHTGGVDTAEAYPAQLERLLHARGVNVTVKNAGVAGDTSAGMLARLDSVIEPGTRVVIIQPGSNDALRGGSLLDAKRNADEMARRLRSRGIRVIVLTGMRNSVPPSTWDPDGEHVNARAHAMIAARLLPQVMAALRR
jgi:acyl-CoA thioesterase-1